MANIYVINNLLITFYLLVGTNINVFQNIDLNANESLNIPIEYENGIISFFVSFCTLFSNISLH